MHTTNAAGTPPDPIRSWVALVLAVMLAALLLWAGKVDLGMLAGAVVVELLRVSAWALLDRQRPMPAEPGDDQAE